MKRKTSCGRSTGLSVRTIRPLNSKLFFGMPALHGRVLQPTDYEPGAPPVFVMRYKTWIERFNGDLSILNSTFELNGIRRTLVGIMPPRFGWYDADVWFPKKPTRSGEGFAESPEIWFLLGRLKPETTSQQAQADLTVIANRLARIHPQDFPEHFTIQVRKLGDTVVGRFQATLYTVLGAVGLLLLIACSNVANLMLARATTREKEFALRAVLGAGRMRLLRLLMVEGLVLAMGGAMLGIFLAWGGLKLLVAAMPQNLIPTESVIELNGPVLTFNFFSSSLAQDLTYTIGWALFAVVMLTDLLGRKYRFNVPGTAVDSNWARRMQRTIGQLRASRKEQSRMRFVREMLAKTGRV